MEGKISLLKDGDSCVDINCVLLFCINVTSLLSSTFYSLPASYELITALLFDFTSRCSHLL